MPLQKFEIDLTGIDPANLISDEAHPTVDAYSGILIPEFKNFFTESLQVRNNTNTLLQRNIDYVPIEFNQEATLKTGKEICNGIILITNLNNAPISLTYQVLGGPDTYSAKNLIETYLSKVNPDTPVPYQDLTNKPKEFPPIHHLHDADEMYGLEFIVRKLQRIEEVMHVGSFPAFKDLMAYIDTSLLSIQAQMNLFLDQTMQVELDNFIEQFTKEYIGVENISNLKTATEKEGMDLGNPSFLSSSISENKYVIIETLIGFKKSIYKNLIRKDYTGLDMVLGTNTTPFSYSVRDLNNRASFNVISKNEAIISKTILSDEFYPIDVYHTTEVSITKLSNEVNSNDGDLLLVDKVSNSLYWGMAIEELSGVEITWKRITEEVRLQSILKTLNEHVSDKNNPHELNKIQIQLDKVENLPVVTKEEIDNLKSVRSYLTFDTLLYLARKHLLQNGPASPIGPDSRNKFLLDNAVVVYSPGGKPDINKVDPKVTGLDGTFPTNMTIGWSISNGAPGKKFKAKVGMLGFTPKETEYTLSSLGSFVGYLPTGGVPGTIQSVFTFSGGQIIVTNSLVQESQCDAPPPEPPPPVPPPPPPPVPPPPSAEINPAYVTIEGEAGVAINYLAGQLSNAVPTGVVVAVSGSMAPGLSLTVSQTAVLDSYAISVSGVPTVAGNFSATYRIVGAEKKYADITIVCNIAAAKVPDLTISTTKTTIYPGTTETITVTAVGGKPNSNIDVDVVFTYLSGSYKNIKSRISISLNNSGAGSGTCSGGNPGAKIVYVTRGVLTAYSRPVTVMEVQGGLPLGDWKIQAETINTSPIKKSNSITRNLTTLGGSTSSASATRSAG